MRQLLVVVGLLALMLPLLRDPLVAAQEQAQVQRDATGNPIGVLGPVNALGQEIKRPPPPTGPAPHLPDGTIDLGTAPGSSCRAGATGTAHVHPVRVDGSFRQVFLDGRKHPTATAHDRAVDAGGCRSLGARGDHR
jgi:hypothetical protein